MSYTWGCHSWAANGTTPQRWQLASMAIWPWPWTMYACAYTYVAVASTYHVAHVTTLDKYINIALTLVEKRPTALSLRRSLRRPAPPQSRQNAGSTKKQGHKRNRAGKSEGD
eukprot:scaffold21_cov90-Isochrysis_galbana.AAC.4